MNNKRIKPYAVAVLLTVLYVIEIFWLSDVLGRALGLAGTVVHEIILALIGVVVFIAFRGKMKKIFPFKKPELAKIAGTVLIWIGAYLGTMLITMIMTYFFPAQVMGASQGVQDMIVDTPVIISLFVVAVTPAICEEIAFRGALLSCFRGVKKKWIGILIVSIIFGACHGSIWRMVPTMLLGIAMGYLLFETENMVYNMLFHFINNAVPVILLAVLSGVMEALGAGGMSGMYSSAMSTDIPLSALSMYLMYGGAAPFLLYIGNYFLHRGQPGYDRGLFPKEKRKTLIILVSVAVSMVVISILVAAFSIAVETSYYLH